jgi:hypothetical protein
MDKDEQLLKEILAVPLQERLSAAQKHDVDGKNVADAATTLVAILKVHARGNNGYLHQSLIDRADVLTKLSQDIASAPSKQVILANAGKLQRIVMGCVLDYAAMQNQASAYYMQDS